ncbi:hypothetical protein DWZ56_10340 [Lachnotalea sp. AF33-28]|nr:hypothetical protein DWZ56_10340 [Lachnotalea sp. AF33-28]
MIPGISAVHGRRNRTGQGCIALFCFKRVPGRSGRLRRAVRSIMLAFSRASVRGVPGTAPCGGNREAVQSVHRLPFQKEAFCVLLVPFLWGDGS